MIANKDFIQTLTNSKVFQDYEHAFSEATGLPVALRAVESWVLPHRGGKFENPFCGVMARKSKSCAACLEVQEELSQSARAEACTLTCPVGLSDTAVPVRLGEELIGFLQTGQVFRKKPTQAQFDRAAERVKQWELDIDLDELKRLYFQTRVLSPKQYEAMVKLLTIFAEHLSMVSNQIVVRQKNTEPPVIARAKKYIEDHQSDDLSLGEVAKAVNTSVFYFCKLFKKITGVNFTDYLARVRVEKAKNLLLNPNLRVSEIAYEVGFQSLTHFNRVFKRIVGESPTQFRGQLAVA
jgi:AraC-like DNA-binding protein/ligand-binding sensor protein